MILPFSTAPEFVDFLLSDERFVPSTDLETQRGRGVRGHVFRGQCSRTWPLYPTAHRPGCPLLDFTPQAASNDASWVNTIPPATVKLFAALRLLSHIHSELRAVLHFLEQADRLGIPTPIDYAALEKHQAILDVPSEAISNPHSDVPLDKAGEAVKGPFPGSRNSPEHCPGAASRRANAPAGLDRIILGGSVLRGGRLRSQATIHRQTSRGC
jgi:hypothetical protein